MNMSLLEVNLSGFFV